MSRKKRDLAAERRKQRREDLQDFAKFAQPIIMNVIDKVGNIAVSTAQSASTSPLAAFAIAYLSAAAARGIILSEQEAFVMQVAAGGYLGTKLAAEGAGALSGLIEGIPFSGDAPASSTATNIQFDIPQGREIKEIEFFEKLDQLRLKE